MKSLNPMAGFWVLLQLMVDSAYDEADQIVKAAFPGRLRRDHRGGLDPAQWGGTIVMVIVVIILVTALMSTLVTYLGYYAANETVIGPTVELLVPILISLAILLAVVSALLKYRGSQLA